MEKVWLRTSDNVEIVGDYYSPDMPSTKGVLLVHMMPATRTSWKFFAGRLQKMGCHVLAIDLRGHGESSGGPDGYLKFSDEEHQKSIFDLEASAAFLEEKGIVLTDLSLVGASIGANLGLQCAVLHGGKNVALLSPGLDYRGVKMVPLVKQLKHGQRVLFVTSRDDDRSGGNNAEMNEYLYALVPEVVEKRIIVYENAGHGTDMFDKEEPDLEEELITWLSE